MRGGLAGPGTTTVPSAISSRRIGRWLLATTAAVLLAAAVVFVGASAQPLRETCAAALNGDVCQETVAAALERGLAQLHPLILGARVDPGPAGASTELGQRATVAFDMLGVPGPTRVKLFVDVGAHWGGSADRGSVELALWSLVPAALALGGLWVLWLVGARLVRRPWRLRE